MVLIFLKYISVILQFIMNLEKYVKWIIFAGVAVLLYIPFVVSNDLFFPFITGKAYLFRIVSEIIFFSWVILAIYNPEYRPKKNWILYSFAAFILTTLISAFSGVNFVNSIWSNFERMEGWVTLIHLFGLFLALGSVLNKKENWIWIFNASILASIFMVFSAFGQILENGFDYRVQTSLGNPIYLAVYMLFNMFLSLYLLFREKNEIPQKTSLLLFQGWKIWLYGLVFILQTIILFQTGTRGAMIGVLGGLVLTSLIMIFFNRENKKFRIAATTILVAISALLVGTFIFKDSDLVKNTGGLNRLASISITEKTVEARMLNWQMAIEGFKERPIFGWGQSNFNYVFDKHYIPEHHGNEVWFDRVHNSIFDWLIAGGIFGLIFYLAIWITALYLLIKSSNFSINEKAVLIGLGFAYFVHNLFVFDQIVSYIYFIFTLSFIYSQSHQNKPICEKVLSKNTAYISTFVIALLIPYTIYAVNYDSYSANTKLIDGMRIFNRDVSGNLVYFYENGIDENINLFEEAIDLDTFGNREIIVRSMIVATNLSISEQVAQEDFNKFADFSVEQMNQLIEKFPNNPRYYYFLGTFYGNFGQFDLAEKNLLKAVELSPTKPAMRIPLVRLYNKFGQFDKAVKLSKETYELAPDKDDLWLEYALSVNFSGGNVNELINEALSNNQISRVEKFLIRIINLNPENYQAYVSLAAFYFKIGNIDRSILILEDVIKRFPDITNQINGIIKEIKAGNNPLGQEIPE
jgi:O-antigen ligase/tetratricopeptide (TPR) repeat protein